MVKHVDKRSFEVFLSLGSNIENRKWNINEAILEIGKNIGIIEKLSSIYETAPWGNVLLMPFFNMVLRVKTSLNPTELLSACKKIEQEMGRIYPTSQGYENRVIDIDILTYENWLINTIDLIVPHPFIAERMFVLLPFSEISKNFQIAGLNKTIEELIELCDDRGYVRELP